MPEDINRGNAPMHEFYCILPTDDIKVSRPQSSGTIVIVNSPPSHGRVSLTDSNSATPHLVDGTQHNQHLTPRYPGNLYVPGFAFPFPHSFSWITTLNWGQIKTLIRNNEAMARDSMRCRWILRHCRIKCKDLNERARCSWIRISIDIDRSIDIEYMYHSTSILNYR
jgi:hypothetical protein